MRSLIFGLPILIVVAVLQSTVLYHVRFVGGSLLCRALGMPAAGGHDVRADLHLHHGLPLRASG